MAGAATGGAELFFERLTAAMQRAGDRVLPVIRRDRGRAARMAAAGVAPVQLGFGGVLDFATRPALRRSLLGFEPEVVVAWMNRAARATPPGRWVKVGRLGGYYDLKYYRGCDHLVGNTAGIVAWIEAQGWPERRVHHLPNFSPDLSGAAAADMPGTPCVLALGRLHRNKGFDLLIRAMAALPGVHALIAGEGPERGALTRLAAETGVADRVHLPGWRTDQAALLAGCDLLVCPSRHEPLGNVIIEAFSAGTPVVAAAVAGPVELIDPGRTGLLVAPESPAALAGAIRNVLMDRELAAALAAAGRAEWRARHAEGPVVARWHDALSMIACSGTAG